MSTHPFTDTAAADDVTTEAAHMPATCPAREDAASSAADGNAFGGAAAAGATADTAAAESAADSEDEAAYAARPLPRVAPSVLLEGLARLWGYPEDADALSTQLACMKQSPELQEYAAAISELEHALGAYKESTETVVGAHLSQLDYTRLFIGSFKMYASPYASYYIDGADQVFGPTAVAVEDLYAQFGLEIKAEEHDMPDHIRYLLMFLSLLARAYEQTDSRDMALAYEDFKQEFLDSWSSQFAERVHTYTEYAFYPALISFTLASV